MIVNAGLAGLISVTGVAIAIWDVNWLGLVSTSLAALIGVVTAWDSHFRLHDLWIQRSVMLSKIMELRRKVEIQQASGADGDELAAWAIAELNATLVEDRVSWSQMRTTEGGSASHESDS